MQCYCHKIKVVDIYFIWEGSPDSIESVEDTIIIEIRIFCSNIIKNMFMMNPAEPEL